jgi:outer membrane protein OmpA-like peptidoglycan-associated protein
MAAMTFREAERAQKRWIFAALGLAVLLHGLLAGAFHFYRIKDVEIPANHSNPTGPFTVKRIEISPDALKPNQSDPISRLPVPEPPQNPSDFNLDAHLVEKALQAPLPKLSSPAMPEPNRVIADTDLTPALPLTESDSAKLSAEIAKVQPTAMDTGPLLSNKMAQDMISANAGATQAGLPGTAQGSPQGTGTLPGFSQLAPGFKAGPPTVSNLPDPVLLRLPSDVLFDFDSAMLKPSADPLLTQAIGLITKYPSADVQIDGYSDSFGKPDYNLALSQQRAQAVQAWLRDRVGQSSYKFRSQGHGSADYVVPPQGTIDEQQPNRRVEILIQALKPANG